MDKRQKAGAESSSIGKFPILKAPDLPGIFPVLPIHSVFLGSISVEKSSLSCLAV